MGVRVDGRKPPGADRELTQEGMGRRRESPEHKDGQKSFQTARHFSIGHAKPRIFKAE